MTVIPSNVQAPAKLATFLAHRVADADEATRPIDVKASKARLLGAAEATHLALGVGYTPNAVHLAALEAVRALDPRPAYGAAFPTARKAWELAATQAVIDALAAL